MNKNYTDLQETFSERTGRKRSNNGERQQNGLTLSGQKCYSKGYDTIQYDMIEETLKKALCIRCRPPRTIGSS